MTCGINYNCKMLISAQRCMRNTFNINEGIFLCRRLNTLKKALRPVSLVRLSYPYTRSKAICCEENRSNILLKKPQFVVPLASNFYSKDNGKPSTEKKEDIKNSEVKLSLYQKFKKMYKEYWYVLVPVHLITSTIWFYGFYYLASSGVDIPSLMKNLGAPDSWIENLRDLKAGNFVLAYTLYKVATPVRYTITLGGTTLAINYLKKWGYIKPVPDKKQIQKFYKEQKDAFKDKMQVTKNGFLKNIQVAKDEFHNVMSETRSHLRQEFHTGMEEWKQMFKIAFKEVEKIIKSAKKNM